MQNNIATHIIFVSFIYLLSVILLLFCSHTYTDVQRLLLAPWNWYGPQTHTFTRIYIYSNMSFSSLTRSIFHCLGLFVFAGTKEQGCVVIVFISLSLFSQHTYIFKIHVHIVCVWEEVVRICQDNLLKVNRSNFFSCFCHSFHVAGVLVTCWHVYYFPAGPSTKDICT